jgi:hypothetical protein
MDRNFFFVGIAFFGMINGLFNQAALLFALIHVQVLAPALLFGNISLTLLFSSLMVSTATIIVGGIPAVLMAIILIIKAREALTKDYRKTEMWLYLPKDFRPPEAYAQWASSTVLRDTYLTFALWTSAIAIVMWVLALFFRLFGL